MQDIMDMLLSESSETLYLYLSEDHYQQMREALRRKRGGTIAQKERAQVKRRRREQRKQIRQRFS